MEIREPGTESSSIVLRNLEQGGGAEEVAAGHELGHAGHLLHRPLGQAAQIAQLVRRRRSRCFGP